MVLQIRFIPIILFLHCLVACGPSGSQGETVATPAPLPAAQFVGATACAECHQQETELWQGSHHALAMQHANEDTVLGDFNDASFQQAGVTSRFYRKDDGFWIETDSASGEIQSFRIAYTFGVAPLQQYLVETDKGRVQALPLAWDVEESRWFHIYGDEAITHDDELHWTGREQNWNYMCAECHSTRLEKNYTIKTDTFATTWSEINVSCEACHGPGSNHVTLAQAGESGGLVLSLDDNEGATWQMQEDTGIAQRVPSRMSPSKQVEACGRCHARRGLATGDYEFGRPLADTHTISLLADPLYFADGQIREEVYVYGSFLQSKMYQAGVSCGDCHEPHSAELRTGNDVNAICSTCHLPEKFAEVSHHRHPGGEPGCVDCHMASRDYMVIDGRRDHSFRVPRPDLTPVTGAPQACGNCHLENDATWAAAALVNWFGEPEPGHASLALHAVRSGRAGANEALLQVAANDSVAGIVRATALSELTSPLSGAQMQSLGRELADPDPLVRIGGLRALSLLPPQLQLEWGAPLLSDSIRSVRLAAVNALSAFRSELPVTFDTAFRNAENEYIQAQLAIAERPEAIGNLANVFRNRGDAAQAESWYRHALSLEPRLTSARSNLADLYRALGRDDDAELLLREGLELDEDNAALRHSLGLLLVRTGRKDEALRELQMATELQPGDARFAYVHAVALNSLGHQQASIAAMQSAAERFPGDLDIGIALVTFLHQSGEKGQAIRKFNELQLRFPGNPQLQGLGQNLLSGSGT